MSAQQQGLPAVVSLLPSTQPIRGRLLDRLRHLSLHLLVGGVGAISAFPFIWMVLTSFKTDREIGSIPATFLPHIWTLDNYNQAVTSIPFFHYMWNTVFISSVYALGTLISCSLVAFSFSRVRWRGRDLLFLIVLSTMLLPSEVTLVPVYIIFKNLGWVGTFAPLTAPAFLCYGTAKYIFLLRQFFKTIPSEYDEAARIDGAGYLVIYFRVILPLARPALAVVVILIWLDKWTDFINPLVYLNDPSTYTLSLGLQQFQSAHSTDWGPLMAASTLFMLPVIALFMVAQKSFIRGITMGGLKG